MLDQIFISKLITLAKKTSATILEYYAHSKAYSVQTKSDHSPCTQADIAANKMLVEGIAQLMPNTPILSEEGKSIPWELRQKWSRYWLIDPLDGTRQFIQHSGEFVISIALIENHQPIFGLIYVPVTDECYYAHAEIGAKKILPNGEVISIHTRKWQKNNTQILASHGAREERLREKFTHIGAYTVTRMGSAWKFCLLAEGKADIAPRLGDTSEWDTAAGQCILEKAGGLLLDWQGQSLRYNTKESLINPHFIAIGDPDCFAPQIF